MAFFPGSVACFREDLLPLPFLDKIVARRIFDKLHWFLRNFASRIPQTLSGELKGMYKFRVGNYRAIYTLNRKDKIITIHMIGHRREIYKI